MCFMYKCLEFTHLDNNVRIIKIEHVFLGILNVIRDFYLLFTELKIYNLLIKNINYASK